MLVRNILLVTLLFIQCIAAQAGALPSAGLIVPRPPLFFILTVPGRHYPRLCAALSVVGYVAREGSFAAYLNSRLREHYILVVPGAINDQLNGEQITALQNDIRQGQPVIIEGASFLAAGLGIECSETLLPVSSYRWHRSPALPIHLPEGVAVPRCHLPVGGKVLAVEPTTHLPLLLAVKAGHGQLLFTTLPLEPAKGELYQYQLFLPDAISETFAVPPAFAGTDLGVFVDWGYHFSEDPSALVARLKAWHIRRVAFSAWYDRHDYRLFLRNFLTAAHRHGLLVEAWLELPMVSLPFWQQHPEWREVTAEGKAAKVDWRSLMALEDPRCLHAVDSTLSKLVMEYDWDGVNCAELYFECPGFGLTRPGTFTPMHPTFRHSFQRNFGVDPLTIFDAHSPNYWQSNPDLHQALIVSRAETITRLHEEVLQLCTRWQTKKPHLHTTLTVVDSLMDTSMTEQIGVDSAQLLALNTRYAFLPLIEDPFTLWGLGADRYRVIIERYRQHLPQALPLAVDINIVERTQVGPLTTPKQRGLEFYTLVAAAQAHSDVTYLYADHTLEPADMPLAVCALGPITLTPCADGQVRYSANRQFLWRIATGGITVHVDGQTWPCLSSAGVLLPAGTHTVSARPLREPATVMHIEDISGNIVQAQRLATGVHISYRSDSRCFISLCGTVQAIRCDGRPWHGEAQHLGSHTVYAFPRGDHSIAFEAAPK